MVKCRDLKDISFNNNSFTPLKKNKKDKTIIGFDTETEKGKCFVIGAYINKTNYELFASMDIDEILEFLTQRKFEESFNFFYNVTYDFQAIIKLLPYDKLKYLSKWDRVTYKDYVISSIPNKAFTISKRSHKVKYFDLAQYFNYNSLNNSAIKFLGMNKENLKDEGIDIKNLSYEEYKINPKYKFTLNKYLIRDVEITKLLGVKLLNMVKPYVIPKNFYSQATFSEQYFLENLNKKMGLPSKKIIQFGLSAYQGGRFEVFKKGRFEKGFIQDIKSAYPFQNIKVPNLTKGTWKESKEYDAESLVSLYKLDTELQDIPISPLKYQLKNNLMIYPIGKFKDIYINKTEIELLNKLGYDYKIKKAYHYYDKEPEYPYLFLKKFYDLKEQFKKEGKKDLSWIPKIIINGFYGKTIQMNHIFEYSSTYLGDNNLFDVTEIEGKLIYTYRKFKAGKIFNPIVANEITANTRVQLFNALKGKYNDIIGFQTDSIISSKKLDLNYGNNLGDWEMENSGETIILGSGIYQIKGSNPKVRLRGFSKGLNLDKLLNQNLKKTKMALTMTRNNKLKKTMRLNLPQDEKIKLLNLILEDTKSININFDKKRIWERDFKNCKDVLENQIKSQPIVL